MVGYFSQCTWSSRPLLLSCCVLVTTRFQESCLGSSGVHSWWRSVDAYRASVPHSDSERASWQPQGPSTLTQQLHDLSQPHLFPLLLLLSVVQLAASFLSFYKAKQISSLFLGESGSSRRFTFVAVSLADVWLCFSCSPISISSADIWLWGARSNIAAVFIVIICQFLDFIFDKNN